MKVAVDTNVLVRAVVADDVAQARIATNLLREAELVAVSLTCLCELVWVLRQVYRLSKQDISAALDALLSAGNVAVDRPAAEFALAIFNAGGDFADGVIACEGEAAGGETFVSFDRQAVALVEAQGLPARRLA